MKSGDNKLKFDSDVDLVFGNINPEFGHASETEQFLKGKELDNETLAGFFLQISKKLNFSRSYFKNRSFFISASISLKEYF